MATTNQAPPTEGHARALASLELAIQAATEQGFDPPTRYRRADEALTDPDFACDLVEHLQRSECRKSQDCVTALSPTLFFPDGDLRRARVEAIVAMHLREAVAWATEHALLLKQGQKPAGEEQTQQGATS